MCVSPPVSCVNTQGAFLGSMKHTLPPLDASADMVDVHVAQVSLRGMSHLLTLLNADMAYNPVIYEMQW